MDVYSHSYNEIEPTQYNAIGYCRLSKEDGAKHESDSIANQRKLIREYAARHPEITLIDEEYDDGYTGTNYDRPGFSAVMKAINDGRADCVIVKDLSRLGREYIETGKYLEMIFPALGVRFIAINDDVDSEHSRSGDDILIPVKNIMNESYCRELSKKLRRQFRVQRANGEFLGAFAAYGYHKSPDDKHKLIIDEYAAEVVRGIFVLKIKGYSQQAIADYLNTEGVLSPLEYKKSQGLNFSSGFQTGNHCVWSAVSVRNILKNPLYTGTLIQGKRGTPNYKIKKMRLRSEVDWSIVEKNHDAVVDGLMFAAVQKMLSRDTRTSPKEDVVGPLAGMLFCHDCGRAMCRRSVTRGNKTFHYYVCSTNKRGEGCSSHSFEQGKLEAAVLNAVKAQIDMVVELDELLTKIGQSNMLAIKTRRIDLQIAEKHKEIDGYKEFRLKLYEALNVELIDREEYDLMRRKYSRLIESAEQIVIQLEQRRKELLDTAPNDRGWIEQFSQYRNIQSLSREVVVSLIDRVYAFEDKRIHIDFNYRNEIAWNQEVLEKVRKEVG